jgi:hypothetical protein
MPTHSYILTNVAQPLSGNVRRCQSAETSHDASLVQSSPESAQLGDCRPAMAHLPMNLSSARLQSNEDPRCEGGMIVTDGLTCGGQ